MRNNWNFSHVVNERSNAFGTVDTATTAAAAGKGMTARGAALRDRWCRERENVIDGATGQRIGYGGAMALYTEEFGS